MQPDMKQELIQHAIAGAAAVFTDPLASPTGFPFKVAQLQGTSSACKQPTNSARASAILATQGNLYLDPDGKIGYRCAAEPVANYEATGGHVEETNWSCKCLCNALLANIGYPQVRNQSSNGLTLEPALITVGDDLKTIVQFLEPGSTSYSAADVVRQMLGPSGAKSDRPMLHAVSA